ncbi:MAG: hypothetical protein CL746_03090 [Chloroflexi bacterium]|nr:hypothetical protein [Chloroflexota bacterium]|tara:strand:+ start:8324 stop:9496 length:1173 start_codon:yes stop_codon:yes gene_type:complete
MKLFLALTIITTKMYFRNKQGIFWTLFFPGFIMIIFGFQSVFSVSENPQVSVYINTNSSDFKQQKLNEKEENLLNNISTDIENILGIKTIYSLYNITNKNNYEDDSIIRINIPRDIIHETSICKKLSDSCKVLITYDESFKKDSLTSKIIVEKNLQKNILENSPEVISNDTIQFFNSINYVLNKEKSKNNYKNWIVPGIAAMAIMQTGIFSVGFTLVRLKRTGTLRRIKATPAGASHFLAAQIATRAIVILLQTYLLLILGKVFLGADINIYNFIFWINISIVSLIGGAVFIGLGLAISGKSRSEDTLAPVANLIVFPMMLLSGIFFPVSSLPNWISNFTQFFPLSFLANLMRSTTMNELQIFSSGIQVVGLLVWFVIIFLIAIKLFEWE